MAFSDLTEFMTALERDGDLVRVKAPVDPHLEVTGMVQRVVRERGPALLFEKPTRGRMPLLVNTFGTEARMARALGVDDLDEIGGRIAALLTGVQHQILVRHDAAPQRRPARAHRHGIPPLHHQRHPDPRMVTRHARSITIRVIGYTPSLGRFFSAWNTIERTSFG